MAARASYDLSCARLCDLGLLACDERPLCRNVCPGMTMKSPLDSGCSENAWLMLLIYLTCPCLERFSDARRSIEFRCETPTFMSQICVGTTSWELTSPTPIWRVPIRGHRCSNKSC